MTKICLNMIVKNESKVIIRLLESVISLIDTYCICDTGSSDNTTNIMKDYLNSCNIPGKIIYEPFRDFGYNRSVALKECAYMQNADYILLLDADMVLSMDKNTDISQFKQSLTADAYYIFQGTDSFFYKNVRLIKNKPGLSYWGVTHEYIVLPENTNYIQLSKNVLFIRDIGDGGSKSEKFVRDIELLKRGLTENPNNDRYLFYLANSYRDSNQYIEAIDTYKKRISVGGWKEEIWECYYNIGKCRYKMGDYADAIYQWMEAFHYFPERIENLYEIIKYYRERKAYSLAYTFYILANDVRIKKTTYDNLFLQKDVYDYKLDFELSVVGYYYNWAKCDLIQSCMKVLNCKTTTEQILSLVLSNYKFYTPKLSENSTSILDFQSIGSSLNIDKDEFVSSTPSICYHGDKLVINVRFVNYKINDAGKYINREHIESINVLARFEKTNENQWKKIDEFVIEYDTSLDNIYVGLEDIRLLSCGSDLLYNSNRGLSADNIVIETGIINIERSQIQSCILKMKGQQPIEKNWVLLQDSENNIKVIYKWYPLTICKIHNNECVIEKELETPHFFKYVRGSTNGVIIENEIWFLCHLVSYEDRRYYYHIMVVLDINTLQIKKYSSLFTFEKSPVEYTLGFVYQKDTDQFLIGYSIMDRTTKYISISRSFFRLYDVLLS